MDSEKLIISLGIEKDRSPEYFRDNNLFGNLKTTFWHYYYEKYMFLIFYYFIFLQIFIIPQSYDILMVLNFCLGV